MSVTACRTLSEDTFSLSALVDRLEALYERVVAEKHRQRGKVVDLRGV